MAFADSLIVLDFETTGLSPDMGDRAIEIGAVKIENGEFTARFQRLMNPGFRISPFIESYTGISNAMLSKAPSCTEAMSEFAEFIGDSNLLAHNASFDKRFLDAEFKHLNHNYAGEFTCSLLVSRRLYPEAPNHQLGTLVNYCNIATTGDYHRALFDAEMTAHVWLAMLNDIRKQHHITELPFTAVQKLCKTPKKNVARFFEKLKTQVQ